MGRNKPKMPIQEKTEFLKDLKFSFVSRLSSHGASYHVRIPKSEIEFYNLLPGDQLHCTIDSAKIERPAPESHPQ